MELARLQKAGSMLKAERFQLFSEVKDDVLLGVVRSQSDTNLVYSCRLAADGAFGCCTQNLRPCGGLRGALCKHLLVLIVGLARAGQLASATVDHWIDLSRSREASDRRGSSMMPRRFCGFKGAEAGELDWRPTETIPEDFLCNVRASMAKHKSKPAATAAEKRESPRTDWDDFLERLPSIVDGGKLSKALAMLRAERFQLFAEVHPEHVCGVVRSQSSANRVYACRLATDGRYSCCTQNLIQCVVSRGSPCKHLLVLVVGLVKLRAIWEPPRHWSWLGAARRMGLTSDGYKPDKDAVTATFLQLQGALEAGEVDWRPTETIPEDFYTM